ncbi:MAG: BlaI/MecI/CopY family transcriptional regulator [Planctomycetota bacterium]
MGDVPTPTPRELEILGILWNQGEATVREVADIMRAKEDIAQNTVQTFLRVMEDKGLVQHTSRGRAFVYRPTFEREHSVRGFLDRVFGGAADQLVMSLLRVKKLSPKELEAIEQLLQDAKQRKT